MDQDKLGLFGLLLQNTYEKKIHVDVVKVKRDKMLMRLNVLQDACKHKEFDKANLVLLDICDKVLNDPYSDEYKLKAVEVDIIVFSSAIMNITVKNYDRAQQIMAGLIMKYGNPIFYYLLGISYFYCLSFQDAKEKFTYVMDLLSNHKNTKFPWPETDILIITIGTDKIKDNALFFLKLITSLQSVKTTTHNLGNKNLPKKIEISKTLHDASFDLNVGIGKFLQYEIYPHIQFMLADIVKFDRSKLPSDYQKLISEICEPENKPPCEAKVNQKKVDVSPDKNTAKKNQSVQVQAITRCKQVQTGAKTVSQGVQTVQDNTEIMEKNELVTEQQQIISNLKANIKLLQQKQKEMEANFSKGNTKDNSELNAKNKIIMEQQKTITNLKLKLNQSTSKLRETEMKMNSKISELSKANKALLAESAKHKETIAELRKLNQLLEKKSNNVGKNEDEMKLLHKNLLEKFRDSYFVQIQFYDDFHKRCENMLTVLNSISSYLTEITVPTKEECETAIKEWLSTMFSCNTRLQTYKTHYKKYEKLISGDLLVQLPDLPPIMPITEPTDILLGNISILIIRDFEIMLQNAHSGTKKSMNKDKKELNEASNDFNRKTDYRKKSNFIHENEQSCTSSDNSSSAHGVSNCNEARSESKSSIHSSKENLSQSNIDTNSKKLRSLISYLKQNISHRTETEIIEALNMYRKNNHGSLSGMTLQCILYNVLKILETPQTAWSAVQSDFQDLDNEDVCPICIEPIDAKQKSVLTCRHVYHTECIREWLSRNRICAVCRMYTVLDEDFPPLKNSV